MMRNMRLYLGGAAAVSETRTAPQLSLLGVTAGASDGPEANLLGLNFGADLLRPALKLPLAGRVGLRDKSLKK